jgi:hypothetical protein
MQIKTAELEVKQNMYDNYSVFCASSVFSILKNEAFHSSLLFPAFENVAKILIFAPF